MSGKGNTKKEMFQYNTIEYSFNKACQNARYTLEIKMNRPNSEKNLQVVSQCVRPKV